LRLELAPPLVCLCPFIERTLPLSRRGEMRLAAILIERVREALAAATPAERGNGERHLPASMCACVSDASVRFMTLHVCHVLQST
jgi:hypothetical protein